MQEDIIYFPLPDVDEPVKMFLAGESECDESYKIWRNVNTSRFFTIIYVVRGSCYLETPVGMFYPSAGEVFITHVRTIHEYGSVDGKTWHMKWFNVGGKLMEEFIKCYGLDNVWLFHKCSELEKMFDHALDIFRKNPFDASRRAASEMLALVMALADSMMRQGEEHKACSPEGKKLKKFIDENFSRPVTLDEMASHIYRSRAQAVRIFKRDWGVTPYSYLIKMRIESAKIFLRNTTRSIKEISAGLSFESEFYFSKMFKSKVGVSPLKYRHGESVYPHRKRPQKPFEVD